MPEARISVTPVCNYRCFFCHNEGLEKGASQKPSLNEIRLLISNLIESGYDDLTFTGGEPFLYPDLLIETVLWIQKNYAAQYPKLTIVSNGSRIKKDYLTALSNYPALKFHISLHTSHAENYEQITRQKQFSFDQAVQVLKWLSELRIDYKINYVLLRGVNTSEEDLWQAIALAEDHGARAIKFLELLVMENNAHLFPFFFDIRSAEAIISKRARHLHTLNRRKVYQLDGSKVEIELQQLTCKIGCRHCLQNRDHTFDANQHYYPCMEASTTYFDLKKEGLSKAVEKGKKIILNLAAQYGDRSPSLLQETRYTHSRRELFFALDECDIKSLLEKAVWLEQKHFKDWYYQPRTADEQWFEKHQQLKIRLHYTNEQQAKIIGSTAIMEEENGLRYQRIIYWDDKRELFVGDLETARRFMKGLDMVCWLETETELGVYRIGKLEFTLSRQGSGGGIVGVNLDVFKDLREARACLQENGMPLKGKPLLSLLQKSQAN